MSSPADTRYWFNVQNRLKIGRLINEHFRKCSINIDNATLNLDIGFNVGAQSCFQVVYCVISISIYACLFSLIFSTFNQRRNQVVFINVIKAVITWRCFNVEFWTSSNVCFSLLIQRLSQVVYQPRPVPVVKLKFLFCVWRMNPKKDK